MQTPAQAREVLDAVMHERARCTRVIEDAIRRFATASPLEVVPILRELEDHIRRPWKVRHPRLMRRYCCGYCGGDGHTKRQCPEREEARP